MCKATKEEVVCGTVWGRPVSKSEYVGMWVYVYVGSFAISIDYHPGILVVKSFNKKVGLEANFILESTMSIHFGDEGSSELGLGIEI